MLCALFIYFFFWLFSTFALRNFFMRFLLIVESILRRSADEPVRFSFIHEVEV